MRWNKWNEIPKALYSPEELNFTDYMIELHHLYDGILVLLDELQIQLYGAENGCPDHKTIKALSATYELKDYLSNRITTEEVLFGELPEIMEDR